MNARRTLFCLMLSLILVLCSCQSSLQAPTTEQTQTETATQPQSSAEQSSTFTPPEVKTKLSWDKINSFPIASESMSLAERRALCSDFFRLAQTFQWTPNETIKYTVTNYGKPVTLKPGKVYAGVPYISEAKPGSIYLAMHYYDEETGVMDVARIGGNNFAYLIGNYCSAGAWVGWLRVVNTSTSTFCASMVPKKGCIPVGDYKFDRDLDQWSKDYNTGMVCRENGAEKMYECYAQAQVADGIMTITSGGSGHVQMISEVHVVRDANGKINPQSSYFLIHEQVSSYINTIAEDGSRVTMQGRADEKKTFSKVFSSNYIPFTFAELIGTDPVEKATATLGFEGDRTTPQQLHDATASSNYAVFYGEIEISDESGKQVFYKMLSNTSYNKKTQDLSPLVIPANIKRYADGKHTVKINLRVGTGELLCAYSGLLVQ